MKPHLMRNNCEVARGGRSTPISDGEQNSWEKTGQVNRPLRMHVTFMMHLPLLLLLLLLLVTGR